MQRSHLTLVYGLILLAIVAGSEHQRVGDAGEYVAMSAAIATAGHPALDDLRKTWLTSGYPQLDPALADRFVFPHFWFYSALAAPLLWILWILGWHPYGAYAVLNVALLVLAFMAARRFDQWTLLVVFVSPVIWWLDKAHTEVFTFALLTIAFATITTTPWWSVVALGAAATQNPPIAAVLPGAAAAALLTRPGLRRTRRFQVGLVAGLVLALLHPVYNQVRFGTPTLLHDVGALHLPSLAEFGAVLWDPNVSLVANAPLIGLVAVMAVVSMVVWNRPRLREADVILAAVTGLWFLFAFAQTTNVNHGGTLGMSRYGLWLIPLLLPVLRDPVAGHPAWRRAFGALALCSAVFCLFAFHPRLPESYGRPTWVARFLWAHYPGLDNPLPEVFMERLNGYDGSNWVPTATTGCEKVLLVGRGDRPDGLWPRPCYPAIVPDTCREAGRLCYANRRDMGYDFVEVRPSTRAIRTRYGSWAWPQASEGAVRRLLERSRWWTWRMPTAAEDAIVRWASEGVRVSTIGGDRVVVLRVRTAGEAGSLVLRPPVAMQGYMMDTTTPERVEVLATVPAGEPWQVPIPPSTEEVMVFLETVDPGDVAGRLTARPAVGAALRHLDGEREHPGL